VNFRKNGVWPSLYDVAVSWLRLQTPIDCIPHPCWMYKVFAHFEMLWMGMLYILDTWRNIQYITVKLMPMGV
jgi:hypothetical protein